MGAFSLPHHADGRFLAVNPSSVFVLAPVEQQLVEAFKRGHLGDRNQSVAADVADAVLDLPLLVAGAEVAEVALKEVVRAESGKGLAFGAGAALEDGSDRGGEVVVANALGDATKEGEGVDVALEERLLALGGEAAGKGTMGVAQAHHKELNGLAHAGDNDLCLAPVDLGVLAGLEFEWEEGLGTRAALLERTDIGAQARVAARIALGDEQLVDLGGGVALLAGLMQLLIEQGQNALAKGVELGCHSWLRLSVARWGRRGNGLAHTLARDAQFAGDFPHSLVLVVESVPNGRVLIHREHLHLCLRPDETGWMVAEDRGLVNFSAITPGGGGQLLD
jgi:hypothetical protein